jgi:hypothetical protein
MLLDAFLLDLFLDSAKLDTILLRNVGKLKPITQHYIVCFEDTSSLGEGEFLLREIS